MTMEDVLGFDSLTLLVYSILLNIPINYHPMTLLPSIASSTVVDLFIKYLPSTPHHQHSQLIIGDDLPSPASAVAAPTVVASTTGVNTP